MNLDLVRGHLEPALDPTETLTWADVARKVEAGEANVWRGHDCAMVTEPEGLTLHVWLGGGSLKGLLKLRPWAEEYARELGFKRVTINGRPGWERLLKRWGYAMHNGLLEKML